MPVLLGQTPSWLGTDAFKKIGIRLSGTHIDEHVDVQTIRRRPIRDRVDFHKNSWFLGHGTVFVVMPTSSTWEHSSCHCVEALS